MKKLLTIPLLMFWASCNLTTESPYYLLSYDKPATIWEESLPIGNGRLGTMVAGKIDSDTLVINDETIWTGGPHDYINPEAKEHLQEVRRLILEDKNLEAKDLADKYMIGIPRNQQCYQPLGSLIIHDNNNVEATNYRRTLDIDNALVNISYEKGGESYSREIFASHPADVIVIRLKTSAKEGLNMDISHVSDHKTTVVVNNGIFELRGSGTNKNGVDPKIKFNSSMQVAEGKEHTTVDKDGIHISGAKEVVIHYTTKSNYVRYNDLSCDENLASEQILAKIATKSYDELKSSHINDYKSLFDRMDINLGVETPPTITTDSLIREVRAGGDNKYLDQLFYQMGRYLTISSSRKGSQPMNLQGIWNDDMQAPWDCKWTLNINLPMNYWMVEAANLSECHDPVFELTKDLHATGAKVAKEHYDCRGFVAHHNTDLWRGAAPVDGANWGLWTFGGAWLTRHMWEHYQYSQDIDFLKKNYGCMKDAALFFFDFLSQGNDEYLVTSPSVSFEQTGKRDNGQIIRLVAGPTMDNQILRDLFTNCEKAAKIVGDNSSFADSLAYFSSKLRPTTIDAKRKDIMEWAYPAYPDKVSGQLPPLWGVNPGCEINPVETPELAEAAVKTIKLRDPHVAHQERSGSWVSGTRSNFWARLHKGDDAYAVYLKVIKENLYSNMLTSFYPKKYFMIDGNLGTAASFNEMLIQSQRTNNNGVYIFDILPALPKAWSEGNVRGMRLRGGVEADMEWSSGKLISLTLKSDKGGEYVVYYNKKETNITLKANEAKTFSNIN